MLKRLSAWLADRLFGAGQINRPVLGALYAAFLSPMLLLAFLSYLGADRDLTRSTLSGKQALAYLAATTLRAELDRLKDVGVSLATRVRFAQLVSQEKWDEAIQVMRSVPSDFSTIDRIFLSDPHGTLWADVPALPGVRGKDFSFRDWYRGVSRRWEPYVSEVYRRAAEPSYNVFAVAVPVRTESREVAGILVLQVRPRRLLEWTRSIDARGHISLLKPEEVVA